MDQLAKWKARRIAVGALVATSALTLTAAMVTHSPVAHAAPAFKSLQVLPQDTTKEQLKAIMRAQAKALGVECEHCHEVPDMAADTNRHKLVARQMMKMTAEINAKWVAGLANIPGGKDKDGKQQVTCATCHQGHEKPPVATP